MADVRITELPALPGAAGVTDVVPIVQGGVTYKGTLSQLQGSPVNPTDDGKVPYASAAKLLYAAGVKVVAAGLALALGTGTLPASGALRLDAASEIWARGSSADLRVFKVDAGTNDVTIGQDASLANLNYRALTNHQFLIGGAPKLLVYTGGLSLRAAAVAYEATVSSPTISQEATGGATGQALTVQAQNALTNGGNLALKSGSGASTNGAVLLQCATNAALRAFYNSATAGCAFEIGYAASTGTVTLSLAAARTGNGASQIDLSASSGVGDSLRIIRNAGVNGTSQILHKGTGVLQLHTVGVASIQIVHNSVARCFFDDLGFRPDSDGGYSIGAGNTRFNEGHFSSHLALGTTPATTGTIRIPHGATALAGRNQANSDNAGLFTWGVTENNRINIGLDSQVAKLALGAGTLEMAITTGLIDCQDNEIRTTGFLAVNAAGVATGGVRLGNNVAIYSEESGGTDRRLMVLDSSNNMIIGAGGIAGTTSLLAGATAGALVSADLTPKIGFNNTGIGFFNTTPAAKPTVTGSRGGNAALASLLTGLATLGLVIDSSS